jgi:hypothetical protein
MGVKVPVANDACIHGCSLADLSARRPQFLKRSINLVSPTLQLEAPFARAQDDEFFALSYKPA